MSKKEKIKELYFNQKYNQKEIAKELNVSTQYVSKVLKQDTRYIEVKQKRMQENKLMHTEKTKKYIKTKRIIKQRENVASDLVLKYMHNQASCELSKPKKLTNMAYRKWNKSAYTYNEKKKRFEFREELGRSYDVPKYIKVEVN